MIRHLLSIALLFTLCSTIFVGYGVDGDENPEGSRRIKIAPAVESTIESIVKMQVDNDRDSLHYLWRSVGRLIPSTLRHTIN